MSDRRDDETTGPTPMVIQPEPGAYRQGGGGDHDDDEEDEEQLPQSLQGPYTSEHFHIVTHKLIKHAIVEMISDNKFDWEVIQSFLESAREMAQADFDEAELRIHPVRADGENWVEAEEAYLGISIADRDTGEEWLSATYWLSELATGEDDPAQVRRIIAAMEKSIAKMRAWAEEKEAGGAGEPAPPATDAQG